MKKPNEEIKTNEYKAVELTDEQLAKVVGGARGTDSCPNHYTECTEACLNANCGFLVQSFVTQNQIVNKCGINVPGTFNTCWFANEAPVIQTKPIS